MKTLCSLINMRLKQTLLLTALSIGMIGNSVAATFDALVTEIGKDFIVIKHQGKMKKYQLSNLFYPSTKYYANGQETTFETLYGVGHIDKARITVNGDKVIRLEVIELYQ